jgi:dipeptidyl-peptidase III
MEVPNQRQKHYILPNTSVRNIECKSAFSKLENNERWYAYYLSRAAWEGAKICFFQRSYESPALLYIFLKIFKEESPAEFLKKLSEAPYNLPQNKILMLNLYLAAFFQNCGNYLGFGDTKFIPELEHEEFLAIIKSSKAYRNNTEKFEKLFSLIMRETFAIDAPYHEIGFGDEGSNGYYSPSLTKEDVDVVDEYLRERKISDLNTRIVKLGHNRVEVLIASVLKGNIDALYKNYHIRLTYGDFAPFLQAVNQNLEEAIKFAGNEHQKNMLIAYIKHFLNGDINLHKESQRYWIQDKGPIIESNIGFIETYLDPLKKRAEWEGFVALVDKYKSGILSDLVARAPQIISNLPWPPEFEIEKFLKPDFTSLDVLTFATSGTPIGKQLNREINLILFEMNSYIK